MRLVSSEMIPQYHPVTFQLLSMLLSRQDGNVAEISGEPAQAQRLMQTQPLTIPISEDLARQDNPTFAGVEVAPTPESTPGMTHSVEFERSELDKVYTYLHCLWKRILCHMEEGGDFELLDADAEFVETANIACRCKFQSILRELETEVRCFDEQVKADKIQISFFAWVRTC
jgi:hypothetical protein